MFGLGPEELARIIAREEVIHPGQFRGDDWAEFLEEMAEVVECDGAEIARLLREKAFSIAGRQVEPYPHDVVDAELALLQDIELGQGDDLASSLVGLADVFEANAAEVAKSLAWLART